MDNKSSQHDFLRKNAEAWLAHNSSTDTTLRTPEELLHELQLHQIELEMQRDELRRVQIAIEESRDHYMDLYEFSPDGYLTLTREGMINEVNLTGAALLRVERRKLLNRRFAGFVAPQNSDKWHRHFLNLLQNGGHQSYELELKRGDGSALPARLDCLCKDANSESSVRIALIDLTERKKAEQTQKQLTRAIKLLSECGTLLIHAKNEQELLAEICQLAVVTGGYLMAWVGVAENDADKTVRPVAQSGYEEGYLDSIKVTWSDTELGRGPTGTAIRTRVADVNLDCQVNSKMAPWREAAIKRGYQSSIGLPLVSNGHALGALTIYSADPHAFIDEEVALLEQLANNLSFGIETLRTRIAQEHAEQELRELTKHLQTVREEEKACFAREIHDELGGTLAALKMDTSWLAGKMQDEENMLPLQQRVKSMAGLLETAVKSTRRIITDLRPAMLDDFGLLAAIQWQADQFFKRTGIECRVTCTEGGDCAVELNKVQLINLFRIFQEALTNVARHSGATKVTIELSHDNDAIVLSISDDGCGLPEGHTIASTSYGIRGMRERVEQLAGKITFDSLHGGGFSVTVKLPLSAAPQ
jgi:PAS domain S-box-containing protein